MKTAILRGSFGKGYFWPGVTNLIIMPVNMPAPTISLFVAVVCRMGALITEKPMPTTSPPPCPAHSVAAPSTARLSGNHLGLTNDANRPIRTPFSLSEQKEMFGVFQTVAGATREGGTPLRVCPCPACKVQVDIQTHRCFIQVAPPQEEDAAPQPFHVFFDIESRQEDGQHIPNLVVAETEVEDDPFHFRARPASNNSPRGWITWRKRPDVP